MSTNATFDPCAQKCSTIEAPIAAAAAGDEDGAVLEAGVDGVIRHGSYHRD